MTMSSVRGREAGEVRPWRSWAALGLLVVVAVPLVVLAARARGFEAAKVNLHEGGVWVTNGDRGLIGRINTQIGRLEVAVAAPGTFEVEQVDDSVTVDLADSHELAVLDTANARLGRPTKTPDRATTHLGGDTVAVSDAATGKVWVAERARAGQLDPAAAPTLEAGPGARTVVGADGTAYTYAEGALDVLAARPGGGEIRRIPVPFGLHGAQLTAVGDQPVILEPETGRVVLPGGRIAELGRDRHPRIQQPGALHDDVLVATDDALLAVSMGDGAVRTLSTAGTGTAIAPVWLDTRPAGQEDAGIGSACAYAAWSGRPTWAQVCEGRAERSGPMRARSGALLQLRDNRGRVALNDTRSGLSLLFTDGDPIEVDNWREVLPPEQGPQPEERIVQKPQDDCDTTLFEAEVNADEAGTRVGRPVIVRVLDNDRFPSCQVPVVAVPEPPPEDAADVAVVRDGTALQVTPAPGRTQPVTFAYVVSIGDRTFTAPVTITIADRTRNSPPRTEVDTTTVVAGRTVRHNVLNNDTDPEADALSVVDVRLAGEGAFTFRTDGEVSYTAPGGITGEQTITYTAADEHGATATGTLKVVVTREGLNVAPTARNDRAEVVVGRRARVTVLANDSDPNGDPLTISELAGVPGDLEVRREGAGASGQGTELSVTARRSGTFTFTYTISDGEAQARGWVRVDAREPQGNRAPVAVRDEVAARPGVPTYADLTGNDLDPDGDLLAVTSVESPDPYLSVALLDLHIVRVTAPAGFSEPVDVRYTVSDGRETDVGVLIVRPHDLARVDQAPVVADDEVSVRAGNITSVRALANDLDPEGERLKLVRVDELPPERGHVLIQGDQLRVQAPAGGADTVRFSYTAADPAGNRADGRVTVRVLPPDVANQPPGAPLVEARAFAGSEVTIPVQLTGLDPDGDVVAIVGLSDRDGDQPRLGHARVVPGGLRYRADLGAAGTDSFGFVVRDAGGLEATGHVRVAVVPRAGTNSPPVAAPDRISARLGATVPIPVLDNDTDADGDPLTLLTDGRDAPTQPRGGRVTAAPDSPGTLLLAVDPAAPTGDVSFSYTVADGRGGSARGIVTVTVTATDPPDQPPVARDDEVEAQAPGATVDVDVRANDDDPGSATDRLRVDVVSGPPGFAAEVLPDGRIRVRLGDRGVAFVYSVTDEAGNVARAVVTIPVLVDRPPVCELGAADVRAGDAVTVDVAALCRDPDGRPVRVTRVLGVRGGVVRLDGERVVFTAAPEVPGDGGFDTVVSDGTASTVAGVVVRVQGRNFPPTLAGSRIELPAGGERVVDLATLVTDLNSGDRHTFSNLQGGTTEIGGILDGSVLRVQAADSARGATTLLSVTVSDGENQVTGQLEVRVLRHDGQPPVAVDDTARTYQERPVDVDVLANDIDPLGKGLTVIDVSTTHGSAVRTDQGIRFTPVPGFFGEALVTYRITDASGDPERSSAATLRVSVVGRPSRPPAPSGIPDNRAVRLTWGAAQGNGAPIDYYVVESDAGEQRLSPSTSLTFDGLANGTPYRFRVAARNEAVERPDQLSFSEWSSPVVPDTRPGTPAPPVLQFGNGEISVSWSPPPNEGTPIRNYQLRVSGGGLSAARDLGTATSYTWTGLTNGTQYAFSVRAENGAGFGEWSSPSNDPVNGVPAGPPGPVPGVSAVRLDRDTSVGGLVQVNWGAPAANGDPALTFTVTVTPADAGPVTITDAAARSTVIGGLRNGVPYTFRVTARNKAGEGPPGEATATAAARPSPMGAPNAIEGDRTVTLQAAAPADNGARISHWEVAQGGGGWLRAQGGPVGPAPGAPVSITVGDLTNGTTYTFALRACNEVGCGDGSPASNPVRPFGDPAAPTVTATVDGARITWSWNVPDGGGRTITRFDLELDGVPTGFTIETTFAREFPQGGRHTLRVTAVNEAGRTAASNVSPATAVPPPVPMATTADGRAKDTFADPTGPTGRRVGEVPPGMTVHAICKAFVPPPPTFTEGNGWWYRIAEYEGRWMTGPSFDVPVEPRVPDCP
jgi:hypothetical protein